MIVSNDYYYGKTSAIIAGKQYNPGVQGSKIVLFRSYLRVSQAAGQVNILIFLLKIKFSPCMPINFVMQGKCLFSDISRPGVRAHKLTFEAMLRLQ